MYEAMAILTTSLLISLADFASGPTGPSQGSDVATTVGLLIREYRAAQQGYLRAYAVARTDEARRRLQEARPEPRTYARRLIDAVAADPGSDPAFEALQWVLHNDPGGFEAHQALDLLIKHHLEESRLGPLLPHVTSLSSPNAEKLLRLALEQSPHREVQAQSCHALAVMLAGRARVAAKAIGANTTTGRTDTPVQAEAIEMYLRLDRDYGTLKVPPTRRRNYGDLARLGWESLGHSSASAMRGTPLGGGRGTIRGKIGRGRGETGLEIGMIAPEIEGTDTDGKPMKLSQFRGKVVVLDFWGDWKPESRATYPHARKLLERLEGKPFALLGVNSDKDLDLLQAIMAREEITWPSWFDGGGSSGPIATRYGITSWPTLLVLDRGGVIRFKNVRDEALDRAVDSLLGGASTDPKAR